MGGVPMPGGWMLSMVWLPGCGRGWAGTAADFLLMWMAMTAAMMLPSLLPVLWRYRRQAGQYPDLQLALAGLGYLLVWAGFGLVLFLPGAAAAAALQHLPELARLMPPAAGLVVMTAGAVQFTGWKAHHLACCRIMPTSGAAWRRGVLLGLHCCACSAGPTAILLALGIMELPAMAAIAIGMAAERLAPDGRCAARRLGAVAIGAGLALTLRAVEDLVS